MARCVKDLELVLPLIWGPDGVDPSVVEKPWRDPAAVKDDDLCIAVHTTDGVTSVDQVVGQTVVAAAEILVDAGFNIEESVPPPLKRAEELRTWLSYMDKGAWLRRILKKAGTSKPGLVMERLLNEAGASDVPAMETVLREVQRFRNEMLIFMARFDAIICPTQAHATKAHGAPQAFVTGPERGSEKHHGWGFMYAYNLTGWPAAVVRAGETNDGLPIGVQIVAPPWREDIVIALAGAIEHLCGGFHPPRQNNFTYWRES
jgi:amidase